MEEENTQQETKSQNGAEIGRPRLMLQEIEEIEVYHQKLKDLLGLLTKGIIREDDHMKEGMILMIDQIMTDHMTVEEDVVAIGRTTDHFAQEGMTEEVEDMPHAEIEEVTTEDEEDMIEGTPVVMIEEVEEGMIEAVTEGIQEGILDEATAHILGGMHQEENEGTQEDMIVDIAEVVAMNLEEVDIEVVEGMMGQEIIHLLGAAATTDQESILHLGDIQVTDPVMKIEDPLQVAILEEAIPEEGAIDLGMKIEVDTRQDGIILHRIVMRVEVHHLVQHNIVLLVDIVVVRRLKDLTDMGT